MYQIKADTHVHSLSSVHAYSTIEECARHASAKGLTCIAITDHCTEDFSQREKSIEAIHNTTCLPRVMHGVTVLRGVEIDIVDYDGHLAFHDQVSPFDRSQSACDFLLQSREVVIASVHMSFGEDKGTEEQNTAMYTRVLRHPKVHILGHIGRSRRPVDLDRLCPVARETGKMIEINSHSLKLGSEIVDTCRLVAKKCAEHGVYITVSSDAHSEYGIGDFGHALAMLQDIRFPRELIANETEDKLLSLLAAIDRD